MPLFNINIINPPLPDEELNPIFLAAVNSDNRYQYYRYPSFEKTTIDLGLTDAIRTIDIDQITNEVYAVDALGVVWKWDQDGTNLQTVLATGFTDIYGISIDATNRFIVLAGHFNAGITANMVYFYDMDTLSQVHAYFTNTVSFPGLKFEHIHADPVTEKVYSNKTRAGFGTGHVWSLNYNTASVVKYGPVQSYSSDIVTFDGYAYYIDGGTIFKQDLPTTTDTFSEFVATSPVGTIDFIDVYRSIDLDTFLVAGSNLTNDIILVNLDTSAITEIPGASNTNRGMAVFGRPLS